MGGEETAPLLQSREEEQELGLGRRVLVESKKLWEIVGPAVVSRVSIYGMNVVTMAFAGHLGDLELASMSIAVTVIVGFSFSLLLGMASALQTLCGQAFGAKRYHMLGVYMQRSWIVLFLCTVVLLPIYLLATPILELIGQPKDIAQKAGQLSVWFLPIHFAYVLLLPQQIFLQCQGKNIPNAILTFSAFVFHCIISWFFLQKLKFGIVAAAVIWNVSGYVLLLGQFMYITCGGCPLSWKGLSLEAFSELWEFTKLSAASGVMICLENWYYTILVVLAGNLENAKIAVDALSICMNINSWELMIPMAFFAGTGVRVANELGAGNGNGARFVAIVSVITSTLIGLFFGALILVFRHDFGAVFTSSDVVLKAVDKLSILLAFTILLNSVQPILSGVAVGSGWQALVAYVNVGSYYLIGVPVGILLGWVFNLNVLGLWAGMIGGTVIQTSTLAFLTYRCDWENEAKVASARMRRWAYKD